jgi:hypothetical protein
MCLKTTEPDGSSDADIEGFELNEDSFSGSDRDDIGSDVAKRINYYQAMNLLMPTALQEVLLLYVVWPWYWVCAMCTPGQAVELAAVASEAGPEPLSA